MKGLIAIAVLMLLASFIMEERLQQDELIIQHTEAFSLAWGMFSQQRTITCAPGNEHRSDDTTRCGCVTDIECEHGVRHVDGDEE